MAQKNTSEWPRIRRTAIEEAEALTGKTDRFPTDLGMIARHRCVRRIQFRKLLVAGGISVVPDGFIIYVGCDAGRGAELTECFKGDGTGANLPPLLRVRARFTVAHEIAHTFLYDIKSSPPRSNVSLRVPASLRSLELTCNYIAGSLLIPEWLLLRDFRNVDFLDPRELRCLATTALVSGETLARRFAKLRSFPHPQGIILALQKTENGLKILAASRHYRFADLFSHAKASTFLMSLAEHPDLIANGGDLSEVETSVTHAEGIETKYVLRCEENKGRTKHAYFLTAAVLE